MSETKKGKQLFTVARVFFLLIVIPLSLLLTRNLRKKSKYVP